MDYSCTLTFQNGTLFRKIVCSMTDSLFDIALLLYSSLVAEDCQDDYQFSFVFGEDVYITRKDEQESLYGYSTEHYHVLEQECLRNVIIRNPSSALFRVTCLSLPEDFDLDMAIEFQEAKADEKTPVLIDGNAILMKDYQIADRDFSEIQTLATKAFPTLRKKRKYRS